MLSGLKQVVEDIGLLPLFRDNAVWASRVSSGALSLGESDVAAGKKRL
jgi:hypothetical protein